jgi:iron-sulfur cluster repair protein YtfE (RIC family)
MIRESIQRLGFAYRRLTQRKLDILDQLEEEHIRVELKFLQFRFSKNVETRRKLIQQIKKDLLRHMHLEETIFYSACSEIAELKEMIAESRVEHKQVRALLEDIGDHSPTSERVSAEMKVLMEEVEHHVYEEENEIFPRVRTYMKKSQLNKLSREFRKAKHEKEKPSRAAA